MQKARGFSLPNFCGVRPFPEIKRLGFGPQGKKEEGEEEIFREKRRGVQRALYHTFAVEKEA